MPVDGEQQIVRSSESLEIRRRWVFAVFFLDIAEMLWGLGWTSRLVK